MAATHEGPGNAQALTTQRRSTRVPSPWLWFLIPAVVYLAAITAWPMLFSLYSAFNDVDVRGNATWVGLDNFTRGFQDGLFWQAMGVTWAFVLVSVTLELLLAWIFALLLWGPATRMRGFARTLVAIPMMLSPVVVGISWRSLLNPQFGWINGLLGMPGMNWLGDINLAFWVLVAVDVWHWTPFLFLVISGGLLSLPQEVLESAKVEGAGPVKLFFSIILPLMAPAMLVGVLLRSLDASKIFDLPFNLTAGGPGNATTTAAIYIYKRAFGEFDFGYAASLSVITTMLISAAALLFLTIVRRAEDRLS